MTEPEGAGGGGQGAGQSQLAERVPIMQRILDNPFLLLFLGVATPALLYLVWGIIEIVQIPLAD